MSSQEMANFGHKIDSYQKKKHFGKKTLIFLGFTFVMLVIIFSVFTPKLSLTGNTVKTLDANNSFFIEFEVDAPELSFNGDYSLIEILDVKGSFINLDGKKISKEDINNNLEIYDFVGKIILNEEEIKIFNGKTSKLYLNGIPLVDNTNKKQKISFSSVSYSSFSFNEEVYLDKLDFITSGEFSFDENHFKVEEERVVIENLFGKIRIEKGKLFFSGRITDFNVFGNERLISVSKS
jgi:hypothetical protein